MNLAADLDEFVALHRAHGALTPTAGELTAPRLTPYLPDVPPAAGEACREGQALARTGVSPISADPARRRGAVAREESASHWLSVGRFRVAPRGCLSARLA